MENFLHSNTFFIIILAINMLLLILYVLNSMKLSKLRGNYSNFMRKLGDGNDISEILSKYIEDVENVNKENKEIQEYCRKLDGRLDNCIYKIGMVRYNAYKDTGSNLSFALAMLDEKNNGIVLNGLYSRDNSNIYGKTVFEGTSEYMLSKEEEEAIKRAMEDTKK